MPGAIENSVASFRLVNDEYYDGTNLVEGAVIVGVKQGEDALMSCFEPEDEGAGVELLGAKEINGVSFRNERTEGAATGHRYEKTSYRAIRNNLCYEIVLFFHSTNIWLYEPRKF